MLGPAPLTVAEVIARAVKEPRLRDALAALDSKLDPAKLDGKRVAYALRRLKGRILGGRRLDRERRKTETGVRWLLTILTMPDDPSSGIVSAEPPTKSKAALAPDDPDDTSGILTRARAGARARVPNGTDGGLAGTIVRSSGSSGQRALDEGWIEDPDDH